MTHRRYVSVKVAMRPSNSSGTDSTHRCRLRSCWRYVLVEMIKSCLDVGQLDSIQVQLQTRKVSRALAHSLLLVSIMSLFLELQLFFRHGISIILSHFSYLIEARYSYRYSLFLSKGAIHHWSPHLNQASMFLNVVVLPSLLGCPLAPRLPLPCIGQSNCPCIEFLG